MQNDPLASVLSHIMNFEKLGKKEVFTRYNAKLIRQVLSIMKKYHYIGDFKEVPDGKNGALKIALLGALNSVGVIKPRFSVAKGNFEQFEKRFLPADNIGIMIVSTNQGMLTHLEAKEKKIGGKLISYFY